MAKKLPRCNAIVKPLAGYSGGRCTLFSGHKDRHRSPEADALKKSRKHGYHLKGSYGITSDEYLLIKEAQGGKCYLCQVATGKTKRLSVDHLHSHHENKKKACPDCIRGLLCYPCNNALGWLEWIGLARVTQYLTDPPARSVLRASS